MENYQSVTELLNEIKFSVESQFKSVKLFGEVNNLSKSQAGHFYFSLNDENASISCALFRFDAIKNPSVRLLKSGEKVLVEGKVSVYTQRSSVQIIVSQVTLLNKKGLLKEKFEQIKKKLAGEGLFDISLKKPIPTMPKRVALITSPFGAAVQDFLKIITRRSFRYDILVIPATVQGEGAEQSLISALEKAQNIPDIEVIVLTRGGGSLEDLWCFNSELLARKIHDCPIPVVSAIGHEINYSISDFVSDLRCETPSAAAEYLSNYQKDYLLKQQSLQKHLRMCGVQLRSSIQNKLQRWHPKSLLGNLWKIHRDQKNRVDKINLKEKAYYIGFPDKYRYIDDLLSNGSNRVYELLRSTRERLESHHAMANSLNPQKVLKRGYSYLTDSRSRVIDDLNKFNKIEGQGSLIVHFHDGKGKVFKK
ncbi:MAG: exodeoxyribonuclease VII large subunit [Halobacteriovoraceae bacterium]|nr:exodeoxyribonuclease VII large subunit [Halobacteriovoraceae bacterium]